MTAVLVVPLGRLGDIFGRVRIYNLGFAIFTVAAIALSFDPFHLGGGAVWLICWRVIQGIGGAMLMACSAAILTDVFPSRQRGMALGVNQVAAIAGQFLGLLIGGLLSEWDWRAVFWVGVPLGVGGTVWIFRSLREIGVRTPARSIGPVQCFSAWPDRAVGSDHLRDPALRRSSHRLTNPWVFRFDHAGRCRIGRAVLCRIARNRSHARHQAVPVQALALGNIAGLLASVGRGGLQFMLIIWLQGIWLPLHGYTFESTPLWSGIYMLPMTLGFLLAGPLSGTLSDRFGSRPFAVGGLVLMAMHI